MLTAASPSQRERVLATLDKLPPFSPILQRVVASLADDDVSMGELAGLIEKDIALAGNILRVVNSPIYGCRATINSVRHGVAIVGLTKIRNLVLSLSMSRRWSASRVPAGWSGRTFNLHSVGVAVLSDLVALEQPVPYPEGAFVAGLLHDVGKLLMAIAAPDDFPKVAELIAAGRTYEEAEAEVFGVSHSEISGAVLEKWNLPEPIRRAVTYHHAPRSADEGRLHLAHLVQAADRWLNGMGLEVMPAAPATSDRPPDEFGLFAHIERIAETFKEEFEPMRLLL
ncbi:MAG: HDOD domain-containing protein [Bryobacteraceae bacterium]